jgi:uncharacterized membrane protein YukC
MSDNNLNNIDTKTDTNEVSAARPILTYVAIGAVIVVVVALIFYAYTSFTTEEKAETEKTPDKDTAITGFNLRDAIQGLQTIQSRVMNSLSDISNI